MDVSLMIRRRLKQLGVGQKELASATQVYGVLHLTGADPEESASRSPAESKALGYRQNHSISAAQIRTSI